MAEARLYLTATAVKNWFQYRCERKFIYECLPKKRRSSLGIVEQPPPSALSQSGIDYESEVVAHLARGQAVLRPTVRDSLGEAESLRFLSGKTDAVFAHQLLLGETPTARKLLRLPPEVGIATCRVDLVRRTVEGGRASFEVIDIKLSRFPTLAHRIQVAFYSLLLTSQLNEFGIKRSGIDLVGRIWHRPAKGEGALYESDEFAVRPYEGAIVDHLRRVLPRFVRRTLGPTDDTRFHIYFKCEQCRFLEGCASSIDLNTPPSARDLSAVAGMSHQAKSGLQSMGVWTVGDLASARGLLNHDRPGSWVLRTRGDRLIRRAQALIADEVALVPGARTLLAPAREDVSVFLLLDKDPLSGRLCTIACRIVEGGQRESHFRAVSSAAEETGALLDVLGRVLATMQDIDARNRAGAGLTLHIYVYEPSELTDLRNAFQRHVEDSAVREALLALVRMFPPEELVPAPEYRDWQRLPGCPVRTLVDHMVAVPAQVSYDLARVSQGLKSAVPPIALAYEPTARFARPFSSRLSPDLAMAVASRTLPLDDLCQNVEARLDAIEAILDWLRARNLELIDKDRFLRLRKRPFRLAPEAPAQDADVELLRVHTLLALHSERLSVLYGLARPAHERRARMMCFSELGLVSDEELPFGWHLLTLEASAENRTVELVPGTFGLVLTNGDHDVLLDPARWSDFQVNLDSVEWEGGGCALGVRVHPNVYEGPAFGDLLLPGRRLCLDRVHPDLNPRRQLRFLEFLGVSS